MNDTYIASLTLAAGRYAQPRDERAINRMQRKVASFMAGGCLALFLLALAAMLL